MHDGMIHTFFDAAIMPSPPYDVHHSSPTSPSSRPDRQVMGNRWCWAIVASQFAAAGGGGVTTTTFPSHDQFRQIIQTFYDLAAVNSSANKLDPPDATNLIPAVSPRGRPRGRKGGTQFAAAGRGRVTTTTFPSHTDFDKYYKHFTTLLQSIREQTSWILQMQRTVSPRGRARGDAGGFANDCRVPQTKNKQVPRAGYTQHRIDASSNFLPLPN